MNGMIVARLATSAFDPQAEFARFAEALVGEGAMVSFLGVARPSTKDGTPVMRLFLDHHPRLTQGSLEEIARAAAGRFPVTRLSIVHRCGEVAPGDAIVFVAAASAHRRAAFDAGNYMMDRLKTDAVFWKREDGVDGSRWIEPTEADRSERARWSE
jgi:molybdopterin synthase catalytic subunit